MNVFCALFRKPMRHYLLFLILLTCPLSTSLAQSSHADSVKAATGYIQRQAIETAPSVDTMMTMNADSLRALADSAVKLSTWVVDSSEEVSIMFLKLPYEFEDTTGYLTLAAGKERGDNRPICILFELPNTIDHDKGIFISFATTDRKAKVPWVLAKETTERVPIESCDSQDCTVRFRGGYLQRPDTKDSVDIYSEFLKYDHFMVLFFGKTDHKSLAVPLDLFKEQFAKLP